MVYLTESEKTVTQRELSDAFELSVGTINKVIKELTDKGYYNNGKITGQGVDALEPYRVKRAVFIAAGFGSRMIPITFRTPKPLVRVHLYEKLLRKECCISLRLVPFSGLQRMPASDQIHLTASFLFKN